MLTGIKARAHLGFLPPNDQGKNSGTQTNPGTGQPAMAKPGADVNVTPSGANKRPGTVPYTGPGT